MSTANRNFPTSPKNPRGNVAEAPPPSFPHGEPPTAAAPWPSLLWASRPHGSATSANAPNERAWPRAVRAQGAGPGRRRASRALLRSHSGHAQPRCCSGGTLLSGAGLRPLYRSAPLTCAISPLKSAAPDADTTAWVTPVIVSNVSSEAANEHCVIWIPVSVSTLYGESVISARITVRAPQAPVAEYGRPAENICPNVTWNGAIFPRME